MFLNAFFFHVKIMGIITPFLRNHGTIFSKTKMFPVKICAKKISVLPHKIITAEVYDL